MTKRIYCNRHRSDHVSTCPRCLEDEIARLQGQKAALEWVQDENESLRAALEEISKGSDRLVFILADHPDVIKSTLGECARAALQHGKTDK